MDNQLPIGFSTQVVQGTTTYTVNIARKYEIQTRKDHGFQPDQYAVWMDSLFDGLKRQLAFETDPQSSQSTGAPQSSGPSSPKVEVSAPNGIAIGGGIVNNPTVNNFGAQAKPDRRISAQDRVRLVNQLSQCKGKVSISAPVNDTQTTRYAMDWYEVLQTAGWEMKDRIVLGYLSVGGPPFAGAMLRVKGDPLSPGEAVNVPTTEPLGCLGQALGAQNIPRALERDPKNEDGLITVQMGPIP
jgi:hypothetical protein